MNTTTNPDTITHRAKDLRKFVRAQQLWNRKCAALSAEREAGIENGPAYVTWSKGRMPSKASKHHAYDHGMAIAEALGLPRPTKFGQLVALVS